MGKVFENEDSEKLIPYIGVLAAVIFAFQFVNYPIPGGTILYCNVYCKTIE